ncbi:CHASE domain-containing protein [Massilia pseudoviolaceinigra]|uniref:CHASE domain-containing protein n=1 Tax=Massilia pseudoviolaceinigra TaxID=3057165 RepID=UPI002796B1AB|nr:CHASE domain-containing protein [Massilia sp. CCM 9206]MDQ1923006.1 CHASE domain-containing protein [Massilia sp. CCM 9206]
MRTQGYLAFVVGICLTMWTCVAVLDAQQARISAIFQRDADKVASDTNVRLQTYFDMLLSIKGAFAVNDKVDREQFARFVRELNLTTRYPGFQAIQFVRYVPAADLARFTEAVRSDTRLAAAGYPVFNVHPQVTRAEHFIIEYTEPLKGNENAFGLDLAALPPHRAAVESGRDSGEIVATERIILVQDDTGQPGFVARAPVYRQNMPLTTVAERRAALVGLVAIVFRVKNLMHEVIDPSLLNQMAFRIHDAGNVSDGANAPYAASNVMFDTSGMGAAPLPGFQTEARLSVAQRQWVIRSQALTGSRYSRDVRPVMFIAAGGLVISTLIAALMIASRRSRTLAQQLRVTLDEQRAFQDSASVGIALFSHGVIMRCNRGMEEMMGYAPGELAGKETQVLSSPAAAGAADPFAVDPQTRRWQGELKLLRKDGSTIWCLINGKALDASDLSKGGVWVIQNISDRKHTEAALVDAKDGLEHSLAELEQQKANVETAHRDLSTVLATLKQAQTNLITSEKMASLGSLVAGIAHELNTPIGNSLLTATALADMVADFERKYADGGIKRSALEAHMADTRLACDIMASSLRRAGDLITSFKQVAVDQTSDQRRRFDLCDLVRDTLATYAAQLRRANCETRMDGPASLLLDSYPGSVGQVLSNLINNALLHAFEGRPSALITITAREIEDDQLLLIFSDDGVGMPPKILHQVFDPFFTTKMGQGGSGLGMNIVYNIVTGMLGGSIKIESSPEHGTSVTVRIPRKAPNRESEAADVNMLLM